jgi:integrase
MDETLPAPLDRSALEAKVRAGEAGVRGWLLALSELHARKLYLETHASWDAYVLETFGYSHSTAQRWLAQGREIMALEAPEDAAEPLSPRADLAKSLPSQRAAAKAQKRRRAPIEVESTESDTPRAMRLADEAKALIPVLEAAGVDVAEILHVEPEPVDVDAIGLRWLQSKTDQQIRALADPLGAAIRDEVKRWATAFGFRSQGTISRPEDRQPAYVPRTEFLRSAPAPASLRRQSVEPMFKKPAKG